MAASANQSADAGAPEIEVTPKMIAAGTQAFYRRGAWWDAEAVELNTLLEEVYRSMAILASSDRQN